jgi:HAE1 family hydrophobic/amphiphilic exporter-1
MTTVAGLLPTALSWGGYNKVWCPFAACMCWGLSVSTFMTLLFLPPIFQIMEDLTTGWQRWWRRADLDVAPPREVSRT